LPKGVFGGLIFSKLLSNSPTGTGSGNDFRFWTSGRWRKVLHPGITGSILRTELCSAGARAARAGKLEGGMAFALCAKGGDRFQYLLWSGPAAATVAPSAESAAVCHKIIAPSREPCDPQARITDRDEDVPSIVFTKIGNRSLTPFPIFGDYRIDSTTWTRLRETRPARREARKRNGFRAVGEGRGWSLPVLVLVWSRCRHGCPQCRIGCRLPQDCRPKPGTLMTHWPGSRTGMKTFHQSCLPKSEIVP